MVDGCIRDEWAALVLCDECEIMREKKLLKYIIIKRSWSNTYKFKIFKWKTKYLFIKKKYNIMMDIFGNGPITLVEMGNVYEMKMHLHTI